MAWFFNTVVVVRIVDEVKEATPDEDGKQSELVTKKVYPRLHFHTLSRRALLG